MMLKELLQYLVATVVERPERVKIDHISTPKVELFYLSVPKGDLGRLLGRKGRTVEAIRAVMGAAAARIGKETVIDVLS
ncbi:MAG: KH domain-containing protein [Candidatus Bipolaricaulia bacterium]